ncbi:hypothetical protein [Georgenia satyanarayanai]|uniref:hypothetical protein n=1 Tax=Georgenia satyanarayanai TaxID=860221 RepID=UPI0012645CD4|nr:hypothetical protein [Georgenia satyanarayanai]
MRAADEHLGLLRDLSTHLFAHANAMRTDRDFHDRREYSEVAKAQARQVAIATWVLSAATVVLALATVGLIWATLAG